MRSRIIALGAFVLAMVGSSGAMAAHTIVFDPRTEVSASSAAHQGPHVHGSSAHVVNGAVVPQDTYAGNGGSATGGGTPNNSSVQVSQPGGSGSLSFGNSASASVDLAAGQLKASTSSYGSEFFGGPLGFASARLDETLFFTNSSGSAQLVTFNYLFDGVMTNPHGSNPGGNVSLGLQCFSTTCYNDAGDRIVFGTGPTRAPSDSWTYFFNYTGGSCFGENIYCGQGAAPYFQYGLNSPMNGGIVDGYISTTLLIPTGNSSIGVRGTLNLDCRGGSSCDFGHTSQFGFNPLPSGVTFSSGSGVFLTQVPGTGTGAVPEPATWAMMIMGFGLIGASMRRRSKRPAIA